MKYRIIIPEQYFDDLTEDDYYDLAGDLKHATRRVDYVVEETEESE